jgi:hypothetical protein
MAAATGKLRTNDAMHILLEDDDIQTGKSIFKPINVNPTDSRVVNPFATARSESIKQRRKQEESAEVIR